MCEFIKNNGEQCGMDTEPFCRHHEDSEQAAEFHADNTDEDGFVSAAFSGEQRDFSWGDMESHCESCETALRRRERLREHPNMSRRKVFEAYVECDCSEYILGTKTVREANLPEDWL
jgi:hypothetical protein